MKFISLKRPASRFVTLLAAALLGGITGIGASPLHAQEAIPRTLTFPDAGVEGTVAVRVLGDDFLKGFMWRQLGPTQGEVVIPEGMEVQLRLSSITEANAEQLKQLPAGAVSMLLVEGDIEPAVVAALLDWLDIKTLNPMGKISPELAAELARSQSLKTLFTARDSIDDEGVKQLAASQSIETLHLGGADVTDEGIAALRQMKSLKLLSVWSPNVTDKGIMALAGHPTLDDLALDAHAITDKGLDAIASIPNLRKVFLDSATLATDDSIRALLKMERLEEIYASLNNSHIDALLQMTQIKSVQNLRLTEPLTDEQIKRFGELKQLTYLNVSGAGADDRLIAKLATLPYLQRLWIQNGPASDASLKAIAKQNTVKELFIGNLQVTDVGYNAIGDLSHLERLNIRPASGQHVPVERIATLKNLEAIGINSGVTDEDLAAISKLTDLVKLEVTGTFTDEGIAKLAPLKSLIWLELNSEEMSDDAMKVVAGFPQLSIFRAGGPISDHGVTSLMSHPELSTVQLSTSMVSKEVIDELRQSLPMAYFVQSYSNNKYTLAAKVGSPAPDFSVKLLDGSTFKLSEQRGKVVVLYFWANWCLPCVKGLPALKEANANHAQQYGDKYIMLSLSMSEAEAKTRATIDNFTLTWPNAHIGMDSAIQAAYGVNGAPYYFVIDQQGNLASTQKDDWQAAVKKLLGE